MLFIENEKKKKKRFGCNRVRTADARMGVQRKNHCTSNCFKNRKYILIMVAQPILDLKSIDFTPK